MGLEAKCVLSLGTRRAEGKALLETSEILFRGDPRVVIPFADVSAISVVMDDLVVTYSGGVARFTLGAETAKTWAEKIKSPKSRIEKLGVKAGATIAIAGDLPADLVEEIRAHVGDVAPMSRTACDAVFFGASRSAELARLAKLRDRIHPAGAIWVVREKGATTVSERDVMTAGKAAGLVDVKVVSISPTHTAMKFVIPVAQRGAIAKVPPA